MWRTALLSIERHLLDQDIQRFTLENGMQVLLCPRPTLHRSCIMLNINSGSRDELRSGTAHMLEHIIFRGTPKYPSLRALAEAFEEIGADFNAYTAREQTSYDVSCPPESLEAALKHVAEAIRHPRLTGIGQERDIIREEILPDYDADGQLINVDDLLIAAFYGNAGKPIAGNPSDLEKIAKQDVLDYYDANYRADRMLLVIVGPIGDSQAVMESIRLAFNPIKPSTRERFMHPICETYAKALATPMPRPAPKLLIQRYDGAMQSELSFGFLCPPPKDPQFVVLELLVRILDDGLSSRLSRRLIEELALVYDSEAFLSATHESSLLQIRLSCRHRRVARLIGCVYDILQELALHPVEDAELARVKRRIVWEHLAMLDSSAALAQWLSTMAIQEIACSIDARCDTLLAVQAIDIQTCASNLLKMHPQIIAIVGDIGEKLAQSIEDSMSNKCQCLVERIDIPQSDDI